MSNLSTLHCQHDRFIADILAAPAQYHFLFSLLPTFNSIFQQLQTTIEQYPLLNNYLSAEFLQRMLWQDLSHSLTPMIIRVCVAEMHALRQQDKLTGETPEARFQAFIDILKNPQHANELFAKYQPLQQLINDTIEQYVTVSQELLQRLANDIEKIIATFLHSDHSVKLTTISNNGDTHNAGRSVRILTFTKHKKQTIKVVYKPRPLAVDRAFNQLLAWFNHHSQHSLYLTTIMDHKNYGWCEFIEYTPCTSEQEIQQFYYREGALLAILYMLAGSDIHVENLIAKGSHPVIIDLECLLTPYIITEEDEDPKPARQMVLNSFILPYRTMVHDDYTGLDISAAAGKGEQLAPYKAMQWQKTGTDEMYLTRAQKNLPAQQNLPLLKEQAIEPLDYQTELTQGFEDYYHLILKHLAELQSDASPLQAFAHVETRIVLRPTNDYAKLLSESYHPELLFDTEKRLHHFAWLNHVVEQTPSLKAIIKSEITDLLTGNIPLFKSTGDSKTISDSTGQTIALKISYPGLARVYYHLKHGLNAADLIIQKALINNSFIAARLNQQTPPVIRRNFHPATTINVEQLNQDMLNIADQQLQQLATLAITNKNRIFWPNVILMTEQVWNPSYTDINFYNGVAGIGLSFAYGGEILQQSHYTDIAQQCLTSLQQSIKQFGPEKLHSIGAFSGVGGLLYTFNQLYRLWQDTSIKTSIDLLVNYLDSLIPQDKLLDVMGGAAGCLAALLACQDTIEPALVKKYTSGCANHIVEQYPSPSKFPNDDMKHYNSQPLLGFSHGIAGIAWALAKYHQLYPADKVKNWIKQALAYERNCFDNKINNWPDFRIITKPNGTTSSGQSALAWCHGAPGIGLARLTMPSDWQNHQMKQEIQLAIKTTLQRGFGGNQSLCHGNLGNLELLLQASQYHTDYLTKDKYWQYLTSITQSIKQGESQCDIPAGLAAPGLMTGHAGLAYQMLHLAQSKTVPSVLLLEN